MIGHSGVVTSALSPPEGTGHFQLPHPCAQVKLGGEGKKKKICLNESNTDYEVPKRQSNLAI